MRDELTIRRDEVESLRWDLNALKSEAGANEQHFDLIHDRSRISCRFAHADGCMRIRMQESFASRTRR